MAIGTNVVVGFNATAVQAGFRKISSGFKSMTRGFANAGRAMLAPFIKLMAVLAPILGAAGMAKGIKDVIDYGGAVSDMANRLAISASDIVVIEEVFRRTGAAGKDVATTLQRMGKNMEAGIELPSSEAGKAMEILGITMENMAGMNLAERFEFVGKKIAGLEDAAVQARVSMAIFGREGGALINTFKTADAFDVARKSVGQLGETMNGMANKFDHISDAFGAVGLKLRQFFAGVASAILPTLTQLADFINGVDLTSFGKSLGNAFRVAIGAFENDRLGELILESLKYAAAKFGELMMTIADMVGQRLSDAVARSPLGKKLKLEESSRVDEYFEEDGKLMIKRGTQKTFGEFMDQNRGIFGSDKSMANLQNIATEATSAQTVEWLKKMDYTQNQILLYQKSVAQNTRNNNPQFAR